MKLAIGAAVVLAGIAIFIAIGSAAADVTHGSPTMVSAGGPSGDQPTMGFRWDWNGRADSYQIEIECVDHWRDDDPCTVGHSSRRVTLPISQAEVEVQPHQSWWTVQADRHTALFAVGHTGCDHRDKHWYRSRVIPVTNGVHDTPSQWVNSGNQVCYVTLELLEIDLTQAEVSDMQVKNAASREILAAYGRRLEVVEARMPLAGFVTQQASRLASQGGSINALQARIVELENQVKSLGQALDDLAAANATPVPELE